MLEQDRHISPLPGANPAKALTHIWRLVIAAFASSIVAVVFLGLTALHIMDTTNEAERVDERLRAAAIVDTLLATPETERDATLVQLGKIAGLDRLSLIPAAEPHADQRVMPILSGDLRGQMLSWTPNLMGEDLFRRYAPVRLPLGIGLIACVLVCLILIMRHVRRLEGQRLEAQRHALSDHLTGLPNRFALELEMARIAATGRNFSLLALDLDRFKPVNDRFGHPVGDLALIEVARRLEAQLHEGEMLARVGGDEFVAIVHRGGQRLALAALAEHCIAAVSQPLPAEASGLSVGLSLGIVEHAENQTGASPLKLADRALYEAKRLRGGAYCFAGDETLPSTPEKGIESLSSHRIAG